MAVSTETDWYILFLCGLFKHCKMSKEGKGTKTFLQNPLCMLCNLKTKRLCGPLIVITFGGVVVDAVTNKKRNIKQRSRLRKACQETKALPKYSSGKERRTSPKQLTALWED